MELHRPPGARTGTLRAAWSLCRVSASRALLAARSRGRGRGVGRGRAGDPPTAGRPAAGWRTSGRYRAGRVRGRRAVSAAVGGPVNAAPGRARAGESAPAAARGCPRLVRGCLPPDGTLQ